MTDRPKILLLIPHLGGGGSEKVFAQLAASLSREKYEIHLALVTQATVPAGQFPPGLTLHVLGASRVRHAAFRLLPLVRHLRPQLLVSGIFHLNFLVLLLRPFFPASTRVLVRQNGTVSASLALDPLPSYTRLLYRLLYRRADRVICQSTAMAKDLCRELGIQESRLSVLPNPLDVDEIRGAVVEPSGLWTGPGPHLLAVGRLSREKGFDLLLQALVTVREQFPHADLVIAGSGPEEAALKTQCRNLGLDPAVRFVGHMDKPHAYFPGATAFVLSSRHEGIPNALLEAAAGGLPLVALPASEGLTDLLRGQPGAWLATEISGNGLASSLLEALKSLGLGQYFDHPFIEPFRIDRALHAYEDLFDQVLRKRQP
ncbi:MAG TPA: glycosyltransferase [Terracidiphilus sp.]|nr:glycosyltransferase [Terracidiphilus sp.]